MTPGAKLRSPYPGWLIAVKVATRQSKNLDVEFALLGREGSR